MIERSPFKSASTTFIFGFILLLTTACGGGGGGDAGESDNTPDNQQGVETLVPSEIIFERHLDIQEKIALPFPAH